MGTTCTTNIISQVQRTVDYGRVCQFKASEFNNVGSLRDRELACSASDRQGSHFESCVWMTVSSHSSHHPQEVFLAHFGFAQRWPKTLFISFIFLHYLM